MGASTGHDARWDGLALGHVLGGLDDVEASEFRAHLSGCELCRDRVKEMRRLDVSLADAEREERLRKEAARPEPPRDRSERRSWGVTVLAIVGVVLLGLLAAWSLMLRTENALLTSGVTEYEQTLVTLAQGRSVPLTTSSGATGVMAVDGDRLAWSLAGLPDLADGERVVVWLEQEGSHQSVAVHAPLDGRVAASRQIGGATSVVLTVESLPVPVEPSGRVVVEARFEDT